MVDLMKIEDPFAPSGDQPDLNKLRGTKQPLPVLGRKPVLCLFLQPDLLLPGNEGRGQPTKPCSRRTPSCCRLGPPESHHICCLFYCCCRLGERELEPGLEGRELPLGARRACGSTSC